MNQLEIMPGGTTEKRISALLRTPLPSDTVVKTPISRSYMLHPLGIFFIVELLFHSIYYIVGIVTGGLFQPEDFEIQPLQPMCEEASGVCRKFSHLNIKFFIVLFPSSDLALAINDGVDLIKKFQSARHMKVYNSSTIVLLSYFISFCLRFMK